MPPPPLAAALMEELVEEILLRFPPHDPALLVRAALVCKQWCRLVSSAAFRRRFREFHRTPPMLGFLTSYDHFIRSNVRFVRTAASCPPIAYRSRPPIAHRSQCWVWVLDARHGRVLLQSQIGMGLVIWDPIADEQRELAIPRPLQSLVSWNAAVLCAAHGSCDHLDCHRRSFLVVFVCIGARETTICTYSSDTATWRWSDPIKTRHPRYGRVFSPSALVGNALYFWFCGLCRENNMILKYELETHEMSVIDLPHVHRNCHVLLTTVDGGLGFATLHESKLYMWSRKDGLGVDAGWRQNRVIDLEMPLRGDDIFTLPEMVGIADEIGVIFFLTSTDNALITFDLKTYKMKKICEGSPKFYTIFPYVSFYTPALEAACRGNGPGGSSA